MHRRSCSAALRHARSRALSGAAAAGPAPPPAAADVVICGAGLAGVSSAYYLAQAGVKNVVVVDPLAALTATSAMSTECYRDYWPNKTMSSLMGRSIGLMEELALATDNSFDMTRRGYAYLTADPAQLETMRGVAQRLDCEEQPYRAHNLEGGAGDYELSAVGSLSREQLESGTYMRGIDVAEGDVQQLMPFVADDVCGLVHARRCGWVSAQQMGTAMMQGAREMGVRFVRASVAGVDTAGAEGSASVSGVRLSFEGSADEHTIACGKFVNAAGPGIAAVDRLLPWNEQCAVALAQRVHVVNEVHSKVIFRDTLGVVPRDAPMMIWSDPQDINYDAEEREFMGEFLEPELASKVLGRAPSGVHLRPYAHDSLLLLWEFWHADVHVADPPPAEPPLDMDMYPEICLRGLSRMIPGLAQYVDNIPRSTHVDGGYYTQTPDNMPLIGPACAVPVDGAYVVGALSGFGVMASAGVGELLAKHVCGEAIPEFGKGLLPSRFEDAAYLAEVASLEDKGQI